MANSSIEWTEFTWNPVTGCTKISDGCKYCYAERMAHRLQAMGQNNYRNAFSVSIHPNSLNIPLTKKKPLSIFVNSMSDLFHEEVPISFIKQVFTIMNEAHWHRFQILTKRAERLSEISPLLTWTENIWMGVTVESSQYLSRLDHLRNIPSTIRFVSFEPLLSPILNLNLSKIDWVIVGGESGPRARIMNPAWVCELRDQCTSSNIPFFFKQWGGFNKKKAGRILEGRIWDQMPT